MWQAALDPPGRDLVLALMRVLMRDPTRVAEGTVAYESSAAFMVQLPMTVE